MNALSSCVATVFAIGNSNFQIGVRGRLQVGVLSCEHAHFETFRSLNASRVPRMENSLSSSVATVLSLIRSR